MRFLSLFAGIGGLDLGLERAGWECIGQVEIDPFATAVLAKHWPAVRRWSDVREITTSDVVGAVGRPDAIVGGFPCQPWSVAGRQRGADDPRHLWPEYYRLVCELRPRWVLGENVPGLLSKGADAVLADLEAAGYTCWPIVLGADDVGAPHRRKRVFFVARLADASSGKAGQSSKWKRREGISRGGRDSRRDSPTQYVVADADAGLRDRTGNTLCAGRLVVDDSGADVADADDLTWHERHSLGGSGDTRIRTVSTTEQSSVDPGGSCAWAQQPVADADTGLRDGTGKPLCPRQIAVDDGRADVADAVRARSQAGIPTPPPRGPWVASKFDDRGTGCGGVGANAWPARPGEPQHPWEEPRAVEPEMGGAADGVSRRLVGWRTGALRGLGNAVVPQVAEAIGRAIMEADNG